ncbi:urease accessory protein UreE [Halalkalibacterium halodurans]|uniref:Urease accessory protein UreE n=1 Tax=Halalkalibacterium halodurans TaxID=86665 RepID=A0A0M0KDD8_ALKHA|nr:urease accessory protein UreE [Halalkalibacterium halodurans]MED4161747.1 urease accessory protein UreE [Halalkalibacterium halodurans]TPE68892.1 urease accessory protein UreE [Halalkalibacterium halodurans]
MYVHSVIGNIEAKTPTKTIEWIELDWDELNKRILRKTTDRGREVAIVMEEQGLTFGDILYEGEDVAIAVRTKLEPAFVIRPKTMKEMGKTAFELGNRHTPCLVENDEIYVRYDSTLAALFNEIGVNYEQTEKRFKQPFKYKGHHHHHD